MKTLRNTTKLEQQTLVGGKIYHLQPHEEKPFLDPVADSFLTDCAGLVVEVKDGLVGVPEEEPLAKPESIWLANMLGDPDAPRTIKTKWFNPATKRWELQERDNPFCIARPISREHGGPMVEYQTQEGPAARNMPPQMITLPPYQRREFPAALGRWFMQRDSNMQPPEARGQVQLSRPRSAFEPDMNWPLDDMRAYLRMMDRRCEIGPAEKDIKEANAGDKSAMELAIYDAKLMCMRRLHFRVAKASARLYSKSEFEEFRRGFEKPVPVVSAQVASAAVAASLAQTSNKLAPGLTGNSPIGG